MTISTNTASVTGLLIRIGVPQLTAEVEGSDILFRWAKEHDGTTYGTVYLQLWKAFDNFESAETEYAAALAGVTRATNDATEYALKGNTADASWISHYATNVSNAAADMATAVKTIMSLRAIAETL